MCLWSFPSEPLAGELHTQAHAASRLCLWRKELLLISMHTQLTELVSMSNSAFQPHWFERIGTQQ